MAYQKARKLAKQRRARAGIEYATWGTLFISRLSRPEEDLACVWQLQGLGLLLARVHCSARRGHRSTKFPPPYVERTLRRRVGRCAESWVSQLSGGWQATSYRTLCSAFPPYTVNRGNITLYSFSYYPVIRAVRFHCPTCRPHSHNLGLPSILLYSPFFLISTASTLAIFAASSLSPQGFSFFDTIPSRVLVHAFAVFIIFFFFFQFYALIRPLYMYCMYTRTKE